MKLQNMAIIFIIIILPISLLLAAYNRMQIDTINLQIQYDKALINATYDAVKAYRINSTSNNYNAVEGANRRDIEAAINAFMISLTTGLRCSEDIVQVMLSLIFQQCYLLFMMGTIYMDLHKQV